MKMSRIFLTHLHCKKCKNIRRFCVAEKYTLPQVATANSKQQKYLFFFSIDFAALCSIARASTLLIYFFEERTLKHHEQEECATAGGCYLYVINCPLARLFKLLFLKEHSHFIQAEVNLF
jgi:hypothetical protein